jgi:hypothetical protein
MKITKDLRLGFPVETGSYGTVLVYSSPITRDTFELYFQELGAVFKACYGKDDDGAVHLALVGPQIAFSALKAYAMRAKTWDKPGGVQLGLVAEIERLTMVSYADPDGGGWKAIPFDTAKKREILDEDEALEVLNSLVFFTAALKVAPRPLVETMLPVIGESLGWEFGSWSCTDFTDFFVKSMRADPPEPETKLSSIIA